MVKYQLNVLKKTGTNVMELFKLFGVLKKKQTNKKRVTNDVLSFKIRTEINRKLSWLYGLFLASFLLNSCAKFTIFMLFPVKAAESHVLSKCSN